MKIVKREPTPPLEVGGEIESISKKVPGFLMLKVKDKPGGHAFILLTEATIFNSYNDPAKKTIVGKVNNFKKGDFVLISVREQGRIKEDEYKHWIAAEVTKTSENKQFIRYLNNPRFISPYIYIGYECNNNCIYCSEADSYWKPKTFGQIKKEISLARTEHDFINFMGREPTLRKDFVDILEFAQSLNFKQVGFTTNGRMLAYLNFTKSVLKAGVNQIVISLNGAIAKTHDRETLVPGSFSQTLEGIKNVMRIKKPEMSIIANFPLNKLNYFELKPAIDLVTNLGIREINILFIAPLSKRSRTKKIVMKMNELGEYVFNTIKLFKNPKKFFFFSLLQK